MGLGQWDEGATVVFLFSLGETLESFTIARTRNSIRGLMATVPASAQVKGDDGSDVTEPVERIKIDTIVVVRPGDRVPIDGVVIDGHSVVDQAPITGESALVEKAKGETVYAGTINQHGYLEIKTTKPFSENIIAKIIHLVEEAPSQRSVSRLSPRWSLMRLCYRGFTAHWFCC